MERGSKLRLFETNENEAKDVPTPRNEAKTPHYKRYNPVEITNVRDRGQMCTYELPTAIGLRQHKEQGNRAQGSKGLCQRRQM